MKDRESKKRVIVENLDLPKEIVLGLPKITITANEEIFIENHKGILRFDKNIIKIKTKVGVIVVEGKSFEVLYLGGNTIVVGGIFKGVRYENYDENK